MSTAPPTPRDVIVAEVVGDRPSHVEHVPAVDQTPDQPDNIDGQSRDLPDPLRAAERVRAYIEASGDGLYDTQDGRPLYARDLEALTRTALNTTTRTE